MSFIQTCIPKQLKITVIFFLTVFANSPHVFANEAQAP